jgi:hypothetical protein
MRFEICSFVIHVPFLCSLWVKGVLYYSKDVEYLSMTICPHFDAAYDKPLLAKLGIKSADTYR